MKRIGISIVVAIGLCLAAGFGATSALAAGNFYTSQFNGEKTSAKSFKPEALAVNSTGDVYVADAAHGVVDEFNAAGTAVLAEFNGSNTKAKSFSPGALAVNSSGDVYVGDVTNLVVDELGASSTEEVLAEFNGTKTKDKSFKPGALAVNLSSGDVYVGNVRAEVVDELSASSTEEVLEEINSSATPTFELTPNTIAVTATGVLYVGFRSGPVVDRFSSSGTYECQITGTESTEQCGGPASKTPQGSVEPAGVALAPGGELYQSDPEIGLVNIFSSSPPTHPLTVKKTGTGKGTIGSTPAGIECKSAETECTHEFPDENIKLKEAAAPGSTFTKWEGCTAEAGGECEVTTSAAEEVKAEFTANTPVAFTPTDAGTGSGEVKCEVDQDGGFVPCASEYGKGTELVIEGVEGAGSTFAGWSNGTGSAGACTGTGPCAFTIEEPTTITATFNKTTSFPLSVRVTGNGEVNDGKAIVKCTSSGGTCTEETEGDVTLTEAVPTGSGSVFAGWIGECQKETPTGCEVAVTAATKVTAVFLQEGVQGKNGEGKEGEAGREGIEGLPGPEGKAGAPGEKGAAGASGATGSAGTQGPAGPAGPAGKEGPAGKVELVTCKKVKKKMKCTTETVSGTVKFTTSSARATLSRHGVVYAAGTASDGHGSMSLRLIPVRKLRPGRYTLTLTSGSGRYERIRSEVFALR
jgi:hypothetical protein